MNETKKCSKCFINKDISQFPKDSSTKDGHNNRCKSCKNEWGREYHLRNAELKRISVKKSTLKRLYGMTLETREVLLQTQNNSCAICKIPINLQICGKGKYAIDHSHNSGKIRGILCNHCNTGLGMFKDNQTYLQEAIEYLKRHQ